MHIVQTYNPHAYRNCYVVQIYTLTYRPRITFHMHVNFHSPSFSIVFGTMNRFARKRKTSCLENTNCFLSACLEPYPAWNTQIVLLRNHEVSCVKATNSAERLVIYLQKSVLAVSARMLNFKSSLAAYCRVPISLLLPATVLTFLL